MGEIFYLLPFEKGCVLGGKRLSFPRKRESRILKLLMFTTDWVPASAGTTNYDTASEKG